MFYTFHEIRKICNGKTVKKYRPQKMQWGL